MIIQKVYDIYGNGAIAIKFAMAIFLQERRHRVIFRVLWINAARQKNGHLNFKNMPNIGQCSNNFNALLDTAYN